jgi:hypothetical protein
MLGATTALAQSDAQEVPKKCQPKRRKVGLYDPGGDFNEGARRKAT